ncbi:MAG: M3 family metallopeptidase [Planctomycetota bacterium]
MARKHPSRITSPRRQPRIAGAIAALSLVVAVPAQKPTVQDSPNPFFAPSSLPFLAPEFDRIRDAHYLPAFERGMADHLAEIRKIADLKEPATFENTIEALEQSGALLTRVSKVFFNLTESTTNETLQAIQADVAPKLARHSDAIQLDPALFARIEAVPAKRDALPAEAKRLVERYHTNFVRSGARLDGAAKDRLRAINEEMSTKTTQFQEHLLADTNASAVYLEDAAALAGLDAAGLSAAAGAARAAGHDSGYLLTLQLPSSQGILSQLDVRETRRKVHEAATNRCCRGNDDDTRDLVRSIAKLRAERANLLGYDTHADYVLADEMAGTPTAVREMLTSMAAAIVDKTRSEAVQLREFFERQYPGEQLKPWDWTWAAEQVRKEKYDLDEAEVRPYFELDRVIEDGMFFVAQQLYGVTMKRRDDLPTYHEDVRVYEVLDADGSSVGLFYTDYYARPSKRGGAWMDSFVDQSGLLGTKPVVVNVMNIQKPAPGQPTLISFDEVTTLFHEFGHGVHGLFSQARYPMLGGTNVPRDYVEFPSQFHEDFAFDPTVLARCAVHHEPGAPLPDALLAKIQAARNFGQGFASLEYVAAALLDMAWHTIDSSTTIDDVLAFEQKALEDAKVLHPLIPPRYRTPYFAHIWSSGYSAGYYAYMWSEALAADAFAMVMERGGMNAENGARYRAQILSRGDTLEPMEQFRTFQGRALDTEALMKRRGLK